MLKRKIVILELELGLSKDSVSNSLVDTKEGNSSIDKGKSIINDVVLCFESFDHTRNKSLSSTLSTCYHYGVIGHIQPNCPHLVGSFLKSNKKVNKPKKANVDSQLSVLLI